MEAFTRKIWDKQNQHDGDRERLFRAVAKAVPSVTNALYAGSFVDVAASFVWPSVTYVDVDKRADRFFADIAGIHDLLAENEVDPKTHVTQFIHADYSHDLGLQDESFDLLISLYAGPISAHCTRYLRVGGHMLVNPSHGDAAMASIDPRYALHAVVTSRSGDYVVSDRNLTSFMIPKRDVVVTKELIRETGRGIGYTKPAFAYLFERVS